MSVREILPEEKPGFPVVSITGVSFRTLPVETREKLSVKAAALDALNSDLKASLSLNEVSVVSTCNRFEVLAVGANQSALVQYLEKILSTKLHSEDFYHYTGQQAVKHLFRVAASLDSMVLGEAQILGQIKNAYRQAISQGTIGAHLHHIFQSAFHIAKRVRSETHIGSHGVSISYVAVKLALQIFGELANKSVVILGGGEMAELALLHLASHGAYKVTVINRTLERAVELAERCSGSAMSLAEFPSVLPSADIIIGSLSIDKPLLEKAHLEKLKRQKPLFLIDLGIPRNFSSGVTDNEWVYLYNIDDLAGIAEENKTLRADAGKEAELIIQYGVTQFERWLSKIQIEPEIIEFRGHVRSVCKEELRALKSMPESELELAAYRISQKISHRFTDILERCLSKEGLGGEEVAEILGFLESTRKGEQKEP